MRVSRLLLRPTLTFLSLSAVLLLGYVGLLRARPYEDGGLRDFLLPPDGCPAPCWAGIQPGVTTVDEALLLLDAHEWIITPRLADNFQRSIGWGGIYWTWNDQQPAFIDTTRISYLNARDGLIQVIELRVNAPFGEVLLVLGPPQRQSFATLTQTRIIPHHAYFDPLLTTESAVPCPITPTALYGAPVSVNLARQQYIPAYQYDEIVGMLSKRPC